MPFCVLTLRPGPTDSVRSCKTTLLFVFEKLSNRLIPCPAVCSENDWTALFDDAGGNVMSPMDVWIRPEPIVGIAIFSNRATPI